MVAGAETVLRVSLFLLAMLATTADARGVSPYLPVDISPEIERKVERVLILAEQPDLRRPIAAAAVLDALPRACERDAGLWEDARRIYLENMDEFERDSESCKQRKCKKPPKEPRLVVIGDSDFASNQGIEAYRNRDLFVNSVNWLTYCQTRSLDVWNRWAP